MSDNAAYNKYRQRLRLARKQFALDYLGGVCVNCGAEEDLEFDHVKRDRVDNEHCISVMISNLAKIPVLVAELKKCQLLCKPCHWEKTKKDLGQGVYTHGTATCYRQLGCRCTPCKQAQSVAYKQWYRQKHKQKVL